jgi:hypothetical protein
VGDELAERDTEWCEGVVSVEKGLIRLWRTCCLRARAVESNAGRHVCGTA